MRRPPHGGTHRPGLVRPGSGYGRPAGRPGPDLAAQAAALDHQAWWELSADPVGAVVFAATAATDATKPGLIERPAN